MGRGAMLRSPFFGSMAAGVLPLGGSPFPLAGGSSTDRALMLSQVFRLAMLSPGRQLALRRALVAHALLLLGAAKAVDAWGGLGLVMLGQFLLVGGIVEGAILVGWRLTQMPKSQALEFLLVSPLRPRRVLLAEALVGLTQLAL